MSRYNEDQFADDGAGSVRRAEHSRGAGAQWLHASMPKVDADDLAPDHQKHLTHGQWCEAMYQSAEGDPTRVPWEQDGPDANLVKWLNTDAPRLVRPGCRAVVVGCGLGDDVVELARRGYDVLGFDVSPTAVRWAARRHSGEANRFLVADLLDLPTRLCGRFDLVVEICTLQSLLPAQQRIGASAIARLCSSRGVALVVSCGRSCEECDQAQEGPPWPLSVNELESVMTTAGLGVVGTVKEVACLNDPGHSRVMGTFVRG
jgi:SAM-dependent methyltransferase